MASSVAKQAYTSHFRTIYLMLEYKQLREESKSLPGIICVPSVESIEEWHGVLFVRTGHYRKGVFKFRINFPKNYPFDVPTMTFETKVVHPLISDSGEVDLTPVFSRLIPLQHNIILYLLLHVKRMFYKIEDIDKPSNPRVFSLMKDRWPDFLEEVQKSVQASLNDRHNPIQSCSISFAKHDEKTIEAVKSWIVNKKKDEPFGSWIESFPSISPQP